MDDELAAGSEAPTAGAEGGVEDAAVLDLGQVDDAVGFDFDVVRVKGLLQDGGDLGPEGRFAQSVERLRPVDHVVVGVLGRRARVRQRLPARRR